jgi:maltose O-acetyltransferase
MTEKELQQAGKLYLLDNELRNAHYNSKRITRLLSATLETEVSRRKELVQELFGSAGEDAYVEPPFFCDYGYNTHVGKHFYCNYDCVFLDCGKITIGDYVMLGPKVSLYTANHPIDPVVRRYHHDQGLPITIGDNVWIGGNTVVCPGVTIGENTVIGAGSVVTHDIPANVVAAGNPCKVIRPITQADTDYWENQLQLYRQLCNDPQV